ncbi:MAG: alpha/beta hydrolase [Pseudorhodoplanes sp.]|jgi:3-oxoadipate enol-lactonase|nr:alpha/beta hydrolase [Pseudorhodoplanes sp.]
MDQVGLGGVRFRTDIAGHGGEWLVLLHELGGSLESWTPAVPELAKHFRVLRYDSRGAGQSEKLRGDFAIDTLVNDVGAMLDHFGIASCHIAGTAIGSGIGIRFAAAHPRRVKSLVLAAPVMGVVPDRKVYLRDRAALVAKEGMQAVVDDTLSRSYPPAVIRDKTMYEAYRARFLANDPESYAALNRAFIDFDAVPDLGKLQCPVLVIAGEHDGLRPPEEAGRVAAQIKDARVVVIDAAHVAPTQAPGELVREMLEFYAELSAR